MIELITEYPYKDENGIERFDLIKHYAKDENGVRYYIKQLVTEKIYEETIDVYPCKYVYIATKELVELEQDF